MITPFSFNTNIINKGDASRTGWLNATGDITLKECILNGWAFSGGVIKEDCLGKKPRTTDILESHIIGVDIDNDDKKFDTSNRKYISQKKIGDYFTLEAAIKDPFIKKYAWFIYTTPSHTAEHHKFRIVFKLDKPIFVKTEYEQASTALIELFGADPACKNIDRMFFGNKNATFYDFDKILSSEAIQKLLQDSKSELQSAVEYNANKEITQEQIVEMLKSIPPQLNYMEWFSILSAVGNYLNNDALATSIIEKWSPDSKSTLYKIQHRATNFNIGTLVHHARRFGFDTKSLYGIQSYNDILSNTFVSKNGIVKEPTLIEQCAKLPLTEDGNAERFALRFGHKVRYVKRYGHWYIYNGTFWEQDELGQIQEFGKETVRAIRQEYDFLKIKHKEKFLHEGTENSQQHFKNLKKQERELFNEYKQWSKTSEKKISISHMLDLVSTLPNVATPADALNKNRMLLNMPKGTFDYSKFMIYPHRAEDLLTKCTNASLLPTTEVALESMPQFYFTMNLLFGDNEELINFVCTLIGISLCGEMLEQKIIFLYGKGKNGKSTFLELCELLAGNYAQTAPAEMIIGDPSAIPNDLARLPDARFVSIKELPENRHLNELRIKQMSGGDNMNARFLHHEFFTFKPTHTLWIAGNHKPVIKGTDYGIWRRILLIPFTQIIQENDEQDKAEIFANFEAEKDKIITYCLQCYRRFYAENKIGAKSQLQIPNIVLNANADYKKEQDKLSDFLDECCTEGRTEQIDFASLYKVYFAWCANSGERAISKRKLAITLGDKGYEDTRGSRGVRLYQGIGLKNEYISPYHLAEI